MKKLSGNDQRRLGWIAAVVVFVGYIFWLTPRILFNTEPATGGDTGSHFYPLYTLVNNALPQLHLRTWNPGNLMGEPHLLHYFPGPYLLMALLAAFLPIGLAFNIGTIFPLFCFPISVMYALRGLGYHWRSCFVATTFAIIYVFNEGYSMWGGNATSLLAGQYAHLYGVNLLFVLIGYLPREMHATRPKYRASFLVAAIAICHTYVLLLVPFVFLSFLLSNADNHYREKIRYFVTIGIAGLLLSAFFVIPQVLHSPWMTGNPMDWIFQNPLNEILPTAIRPLVVILLITLPGVMYWLGAKKIEATNFGGEMLFWIIPILASVAMFFVFPKLGLVDARIIPQVQLFVSLIAALMLCRALEPLEVKTQNAVAICTVILGLYWSYNNVSNYPHWVRWNYSSWKAKPKFPQAQQIFDKFRGNFSQPRITYEHSPILNDAGTTRVFENLPYFANRSTMESLYQEAIHTAPLTHYLQARVSKQPSCPIRGWECPPMDFKGLEPIMNVLGVQSVILTSSEAKSAILQEPAFQKIMSTETFEVHSLKKMVSLVETMPKAPTIATFVDFKREFHAWLKNYNGSQDFLLMDRNMAVPAATPAPVDCQASVQVGFDGFELTTACPGSWHLLKFAYHPTFKADSGDPIFMVTPGLMAVVPTKDKVIFKFGQSWQWVFAGVLSFLTAVLLIAHEKWGDSLFSFRKK